MGMNGRVGRARILKRIRNENERRAIAAGIDPNDRAAIHAWVENVSRAFYHRLNAERRRNEQEPDR